MRMTIPLLFRHPDKLPFLVIETLLLSVTMTLLLLGGRLSNVLFLQGMDLLVIPGCALYAAFRRPAIWKSLRFRDECLTWLVFIGFFFILRVLLNTWAYGGHLFDFPHGSPYELNKTIVTSTLFFSFFRCCHYGYSYLRYKKATSLQWKLTHHLVLFGISTALSLLLLAAFLYAFSPFVSSWLKQDLPLFSALLHRVVLGFLTFFAVGFSLLVLASPLFFSLCAGASFFSAKPISQRLIALSQAATNLEPGRAVFPVTENCQDETAALQRELQGTLAQWSQTLAELKQERLAQEQLFKAHCDLVAKVSHELRNPLTVAQCTLQTVKQSPRNPSNAYKGSELNHLEDQLNCFQSLLEDLPGASPSPPMQVRCRAGALDRLVRKVCHQWRPIAWERYRVTLETQTPENTEMIAFDNLRMRQVLVNLVHNALRFSQPGGVVMIILTQTEQGQLLEVRDTGSGIAPEDLEQIWEPYVTGGVPGKSQTGLGLALVKEFVHGMGAQIQVYSKLNQGTTFSITLPFTMATNSRHSLESLVTPSL